MCALKGQNGRFKCQGVRLTLVSLMGLVLLLFADKGTTMCGESENWRTVGLLHLVEQLSGLFSVFANLLCRSVDLRRTAVLAHVFPGSKALVDLSHLLEELTKNGRASELAFVYECPHLRRNK